MLQVLVDTCELQITTDMERNISKSATRPCYLTDSDLRFRYQWVGVVLGFSYNLDSDRFKRGLHRVLEIYTSLAGR